MINNRPRLFNTRMFKTKIYEVNGLNKFKYQQI